MPWAANASRLTLPSGLRIGANCGSLAKSRCKRSSVVARCSLSAAASITRSRMRLSSVCRFISGVSKSFGSAVGIWRRTPLHLIAVRRVPFGLADRLTSHRGHGVIGSFIEPSVTLDAQKNERGDDEDHQNPLEDTHVLTNEIKHRGCLVLDASSPGTGREQVYRTEDPDTKKANRVRLVTTQPMILSAAHCAFDLLDGSRMVGAEGLEPPTYAL